jgi:DNA-binding MarR family transcriptional regulator
MVQASVPQQWSPASREDDLAVAFIRLARQMRASHGNAPALACLSVVGELGPIRVSRLASELGLDTSTVSRLVNQLVSADLLARMPDPADQRACLLTVTPEGSEHMRQGLLKRAQLLGAATAGWPVSDVITLTELINRLAGDLTTTTTERKERA